MKNCNKDTNGNYPYLAEGESPEGVGVIYVGVARRPAAKMLWRDRRAARNHGRHLSSEPAPEAAPKRLRRFRCFCREGAKIEDGPDGPLALESLA
jgi:uncharacterized protein with von Willebrand factor type A (vWA) domain